MEDILPATPPPIETVPDHPAAEVMRWWASLTPSEAGVMVAAMQHMGASRREIARQAGVGPRAVSRHLASVRASIPAAGVAGLRSILGRQ